MKIYNFRLNKIYKKFKKDIENHIKSLNIDEKVERIILQRLKETTDTKRYIDIYTFLYPYYRSTISGIINHSVYLLRIELESKNYPPLKPNHQLLLRSLVNNNITGIFNKALEVIIPTIKRFNDIGCEPQDELAVFGVLINILFEMDNEIIKQFSELFQNYNSVIQPFRDSRRSTIAILISILGFLLTIIINYRNELWNMFFSK